MFAQLGLKPGDRLIDIGCGYGDWLDYARSRGVDVVGVNISLEQANYAKTHRGLDVLARNWKDISGDARLREQLFGQFDAVTFLDTIEHYVPSTHRKSLEKQGAIYRQMFELAAHLLRPQAQPGRVFISCLHQNDKTWGWQANVAAYFLTRYHSGFYPMGRDGLSRWSRDWFNERARWDKTEDYRLTGVLDREHFQAPKIRWTLRKLCMIPLLLLCDPHHVHKWIGIKADTWMRLFGDRRWDERYDPQFRQKVSYVILWWLLLERSLPVGAATEKSSGNRHATTPLTAGSRLARRSDCTGEARLRDGPDRADDAASACTPQAGGGGGITGAAAALSLPPRARMRGRSLPRPAAVG